MPYIGNTPADKFLTLAKQNFSTSATTSYTLDSAVSSTQDIALFINNVRQSPVDAYTVSGTALTLTSATAGTDEMYCVYLGKTVGTVSPSANSITNAMMTDDSVGLAELSATGTPSSSNFLRGDNSWASAGGDNTPAFFAYRASSTQSATSDTATKVQFNGEIFDTDNTFDSSTNYRFTPAVAGKYHLSSHVRCTNDTQQKGINAQMGIYKNGSVFIQSKPFDFYTAGYAGIVSSWGCTIDCILDSDTDDYFEVYITYNTSSGNLTFLNSDATDIRTWFQGYKLIGV